MSAQDKIKVIAYLRENPQSTAEEVGKACGLAPKAHSMALYSMKKTGLIIETNRIDETYPVYSVNPEADPAELENPRMIYKRKRGEQRNHRMGSIEKNILSVMSTEEAKPLSDITAVIQKMYAENGKEVRRAYVSKLLKRMAEIRYVETLGDDYDGPWIKIKDVKE